MSDRLSWPESRLDELGIRATFLSSPRPRGAEIRLARGASAQQYSLLEGPAISAADIARASTADLPVLVLTTYAAPRTIDMFRRVGVQYLDAAGNAWIAFGDVLVDVRGRPRPDHAIPKRAASNLFSSGRAQVVCALLAWPHLWFASRRDVARAAGVSTGQAHNALALLAEAGYDSVEVGPRQTSLLDLWAAAFPTGLAQSLTLASFHGGIDEIKVAKPGDIAFVSGEVAVNDVLRPATLTLYVDELDPRLPVVNRWRADGKPNIVVRRAFWHAPDENELADGLNIAPWPLVYADLLSGDDPRVRAAATQWRDRHAGPAAAR